MITPCDAFMNWFDEMPLLLRKYLAHAFRVCTTDDASLMLSRPEASLEGFRNWALSADFPLRIAARMFYIRAIFDMVMVHHRSLGAVSAGFRPSENDKIVSISSRQWEEALKAWSTLRNRELADTYIHSWASWTIGRQAGGA